MKRFILLCAVGIIHLHHAAAQTGNSIYPFMEINGIPLVANKSSIVKLFGKPQRIYRPHYDCGFFSEDQGHPYYLLQYANLNWIGNEKEGYQAEDIFFTPESNYQLTFKGHSLSANTSIQEFMKLSGIKEFTTSKAGESPEDLLRFTHRNPNIIKAIDLLPAKGDGKYIFFFVKDKLVKVELWTPC